MRVLLATLLLSMLSVIGSVESRAADGGGVAGGTQSISSSSGTENLLKDLASVLGPVGILGWYCYYVTAKAMPKKDAILVAAQDKFHAEANNERNAHAQRIDNEMAQHTKQVEALVSEIKASREAMLEVVRRCEKSRSLTPNP